jgi:diacylglycerol kinase family enzyme
VVDDDAQAREVVEAARRSSQPIPPIGLRGGDLCRTLGGRGDRARLGSSDAFVAPVDLGSALVDGRQHWFVAHLVARRSWWRGRVVAVMNAQWLGQWDVAPRSHPGDGRLDVIDGDLSLRDRISARRRLLTGTHVPHADLLVSQTAAGRLHFERPMNVWLDGVDVGRASDVVYRVEPDALRVVV